MQYDIPYIKIASALITNKPLLEKIKQTKWIGIYDNIITNETYVQYKKNNL